jgi:hypothetical protein
VYLLPGQGRAPGSITAQIHVIRFLSNLGEVAEDPLPVDINLKLDGFNIQNRGFGTDDPQNPNPPFPPSRTFQTLDLTFTRFLVEDDFGNQNTFQAAPFQETFLDEGEFTAYRGRTTAMQFYINDSMMIVDNVNGSVGMDRAAFLAANRNPETGKMRGFLSDYLQFDISAVPNRPLMPSPLQFPPQESRAGKVFATGDSFAIGDKDPRGVNGSNGLFVYLTPSSFFEGFYRPQDPTTQVKSYELKQADPTVVGPELRLITALKGKYRDYTEVFSNLHDTEFILLPKSGDGPKQDCIVLKRAGGTINNMWFGTVDYSGSGSPTFRIYPIKNLYPASTAGEIRGTLPANDLVGANGQTVSIGSANYWRNVRYGSYKFNSTPPSGLTSTGDFVVFRI